MQFRVQIEEMRQSTLTFVRRIFFNSTEFGGNKLATAAVLFCLLLNDSENLGERNGRCVNAARLRL